MYESLNIKDEMSTKVGKGFNGSIGLVGHMVAKLYGPNGKLKDKRIKDNQVQDNILAMLTDIISETPTGTVKPGWMELGTGSGQNTAANTLATYISGSRTALDSSVDSSAVLTMVCTFAAGTGTGAITEAGIFNVVTQDTTDLQLYNSFSVINKGADDSLVVTWTLTFAAA